MLVENDNFHYTIKTSLTSIYCDLVGEVELQISCQDMNKIIILVHMPYTM